MLNIFLFPFHRFVIQFIQFWSPILFIYAPAPIQGLMYFLLCCFTVTQCQLSLFNGGYLKAGGTKRVHIAALFIPASWIGWKKNLVKRNASQWTQKKCTMLTVFQIPLIGFFTMRRKPPLFLSSTSTNNALTKPPNPAFCSWTKPPRLSKRSHWRTKKKKKRIKKPLFSLFHPPRFFFLQERKKEWGGGVEGLSVN